MKGSAMALIWLVLGVVLVLAELRHFAFYALFGAVGAFAAALVAVVWPDGVVVQLLAGVVVGGLGIWLVRPLVSSAFRRGGDVGLGRGVHGALVGQEVITLDVVGPGRNGHVRLAGESWLAMSGSDALIPPGTDVLVTAVEGTTLIVWPVGGHGVAFLESDASNAVDPVARTGSTASTPADVADVADVGDVGDVGGDAGRDIAGSVDGDVPPAPSRPEGEQS